LPDDPKEVLEEGAQIVADPGQAIPMTMIGHVTSSYFSPTLDRGFALALVRAGRRRMGETLHVPMEDRAIAVKVTEPVFYDQDGERMRA
jgi:sarcosine oxidase, subunit alpha